MYLGITCFLTPGHAFFGFYMLIVGIVYLVLYKLTSMHMQKVRDWVPHKSFDIFALTF